MCAYVYSINENYYCKIEYYCTLLQQIFILNSYGKIIRVIKIQAHGGYTGNEIADFSGINGN